MMNGHRKSRHRLRRELALDTGGRSGPRTMSVRGLPHSHHHGRTARRAGMWMTADREDWMGMRATFSDDLMSIDGRACPTSLTRGRPSNAPLTIQLQIAFVSTILPMSRGRRDRPFQPLREMTSGRGFGTGGIGHACLPIPAGSPVQRMKTPPPPSSDVLAVPPCLRGGLSTIAMSPFRQAQSGGRNGLRRRFGDSACAITTPISRTLFRYGSSAAAASK